VELLVTFESLLAQLQESDPTKRIQALRILALVEETRAVNTILALYKSDPHPQVREIAKWAGGIIWRASQTGYDSEAAMRAFIEGGRKTYAQEALVDRLAIEVAPKDKQEHEEMLSRMIRDQSESLSQRYASDGIRALPNKTDTQVMDHLSAHSPLDDLDLLAAGLRHLSP
jgi:hypothetical protein